MSSTLAAHRLVEIADAHRRALRRHQSGGGASDARRASGDDSDLVAVDPLENLMRA